MKCLSLFILCLIFGVSIALFSNGPVTELSDLDFEEKMATYEHVLVLFYVSDGSYGELIPAFEKASYYCDKKSLPVIFVKVLCNRTGQKTCDAYGVEHTELKYFKNGNYEVDYEDIHSAAGIVRFLEVRISQIVKVLDDDLQLKKFLEESDGAVIGFFSDRSELLSAFTEVADEMSKMLPFAVMKGTQTFLYEISSEAVVVLRPSYLNNVFEETKAVYYGPASTEDLTVFIKKIYYGLAGYRNSNNTEDFPAPLIVAYFDVDYVKNLKHTNYWRNRVLMVAKEYKDKVKFAVSSREKLKSDLKKIDIGLELTNRNIVVVARNAEDENFIMNDPFTVDGLKNFVDAFMEGKLSPYIKSEAIPRDNSGPVMIVVGKNFAEVVTKNEKDTFIQFYAPRCGLCKELAPVFEKLGETLENEDVIIAKMDVTANDAPKHFEIDGYPTLYWVPKNNKSAPEKYKGGRELTDLIEFIALKATDELKRYDREGKPKHIKLEL